MASNIHNRTKVLFLVDENAMNSIIPLAVLASGPDDFMAKFHDGPRYVYEGF
jgi:hypothetical protein